MAAEVKEAGGEVTTLARRPDSQADADAILAAAIAAYGAVDSVFVASGYNKPAPIEDMPYEDWQAIMDANVRGPWLMAKAFGQHLAGRARQAGTGLARTGAASCCWSPRSAAGTAARPGTPPTARPRAPPTH